jgi:hypothetical protein
MSGLYYCMGGNDTDGAKRTPFVFDRSGQKVRFVAFCRRCHRGLCRQIEIGPDDSAGEKSHNVVFVEPCSCTPDTVPVPYADRYLLASREPA